MSKPLFDRTQGTTNAYLGWNDNQLQRRPPGVPLTTIITGLPWICIRWQLDLASVGGWTNIPFDLDDFNTTVCIHDPDPSTGLTPNPATGSDPGDVFESFVVNYTTGKVTIHSSASGLVRHNLTIQYGSRNDLTWNFNRGCRFQVPFQDDGAGREAILADTDVGNIVSSNDWNETTMDGFRYASASDTSGQWQPQYYHDAGEDILASVQFVLVSQTTMGGIWCNSG